jgi:hypothetical protein
MDSRQLPPQVSMKRRSLIFALGMVVLLVMFWIGGDNGVVYVASLLGVPIVSGVLAGLHWIRYWLAALACLAVVALDVVFDETRAEDAVFFAVLAVVMVGTAALTLWVTGQIVRRRGGRAEGDSN